MPPSIVSNGLLDVAAAAAFTALIVQQTKFLIEYLVKPENSNHDSILRLYVDLVALAVVISAESVTGVLHPQNGLDWFNAVVQGFAVALAAISGYHLLTGLPTGVEGTLVAVQPEASVEKTSIMAPVGTVPTTSQIPVGRSSGGSSLNPVPAGMPNQETIANPAGLILVGDGKGGLTVPAPATESATGTNGRMPGTS